jgi:hypothetical protein
MKTETALIEMALGRIFGMTQRPFRPSDIEEYERCRAIVMGTAEPAGYDYRPDYARDYYKISGR